MLRVVALTAACTVGILLLVVTFGQLRSVEPLALRGGSEVPVLPAAQPLAPRPLPPYADRAVIKTALFAGLGLSQEQRALAIDAFELNGYRCAGQAPGIFPAVWRDGDGIRDSWCAWFHNHGGRVLDVLQRLPLEPGKPQGGDPIPIGERLAPEPGK